MSLLSLAFKGYLDPSLEPHDFLLPPRLKRPFLATGPRSAGPEVCCIEQAPEVLEGRANLSQL